jgi:peptidoglycan biosynthesis protein MviN/MurJ (putative lipid II flippase)
MPWAFVQYTWFGLTVIANKYLICTDRPRLGILPLLLSLVVGVAVTASLAPRFGLMGVATATVVANAVGLGSLLFLTRACGMQWDRGVWIAACLPLSLALGGGASLAIAVIVLAVSWYADWLFEQDERQQLRTAAAMLLQSLLLPRWRRQTRAT